MKQTAKCDPSKETIPHTTDSTKQSIHWGGKEKENYERDLTECVLYNVHADEFITM